MLWQPPKTKTLRFSFQISLGVHVAQAGPRSYSESGWQKLARGGSLGMRWHHSKGWMLSQGQGLLQSPAQAKLQTKNSTSRRLEPPQPTGQAAPRHHLRDQEAEDLMSKALQSTLLSVTSLVSPLHPHIRTPPEGKKMGVGRCL